MSRPDKEAARKKGRPTPQLSAEAQPSPWWELRGWRAVAAIALAVLVFYWIPLTSSNASIHWDAVDVHYSSQKYFADRVMAGELPFWTPYLFSGFPFLADIQVGAWYPLNWPFFVSGITPRAIEGEVALHAFLACLGVFLLLLRFVRSRWAALAGSMLYGFSGYFADHSSHVGMFCAAALMPWLLLFFDYAMERAAVRFTVLAGVIGGAIILTGHFQAALYSFAALGLFASASMILRRKFARTAAVLAGMGIVAVGLSAVMWLPGLELTRYSIRSTADFSLSHNRILRPVSLLNVILPHGVEKARHIDPEVPIPEADDVNFYLYGGILLLPLAALGLRNRASLPSALLLAVPTFWYMFGPDAGFYRIVALLPGLRNVRAPIHLWFVTALGLALLAAAGSAWLFERKPYRWLPPLLAVVVFGDLFWSNSLTNTHAYARQNFDETYGAAEQLARDTIIPSLAPLTRYDQPDRLLLFGPLNHPLDLKMETTYGYNPLELQSYAEYIGAMGRNAKLRAGLNVSFYMVPAEKAAKRDPDMLPRAYFARRIVAAKDREESARLLEALDPAQATIVTGDSRGIAPSPAGLLSISEYREQAYRIHYNSPVQALLKLSVPWYPGWQATVDGVPCRIVHADHALMGIVVPAGEKDLSVRFRSNYFGIGFAISALFAGVAVAVLWRTRRPD